MRQITPSQMEASSGYSLMEAAGKLLVNCYGLSRFGPRVTRKPTCWQGTLLPGSLDNIVACTLAALNEMTQSNITKTTRFLVHSETAYCSRVPVHRSYRYNSAMWICMWNKKLRCSNIGVQFACAPWRPVPALCEGCFRTGEVRELQITTCQALDWLPRSNSSSIRFGSNPCYMLQAASASALHMQGSSPTSGTSDLGEKKYSGADQPTLHPPQG